MVAFTPRSTKVLIDVQRYVFISIAMRYSVGVVGKDTEFSVDLLLLFKEWVMEQKENENRGQKQRTAKMEVVQSFHFVKGYFLQLQFLLVG